MVLYDQVSITVSCNSENAKDLCLAVTPELTERHRYLKPCTEPSPM